MAMSPQQKQKILARAKILKDGGPAALAMLSMLDAFETRLSGIQGEQGPSGEVGQMGPMGLLGPQGPAGPMGAQGFDGKDGKQGPQGKDGPPGPIGRQGPPGERGERGYTGKDGVLPTGEELKRMILSLDGQWFPASHIKDLPTVTRELPNLSIFGGSQGGGGARLEVVAAGVSLGQDIRKILFSGTGFSSGVRTADGVITLSFSGGGGGGTWGSITGTLSDQTDLQAALDAKQPLDSDLTTIAGLTATTNNIIQSVASAWASRTPTQVTATLITMVGDTGTGGTKGLVPAPGAGDAAAGKFLKADGTWVVPSDVDTGITQLTGDVTAGPGNGSQAATIANDAVTFAKFQNITDNRLLGRSAGSSGDMQEITVSTGLSLAAGVLTSTITQYTDEMAQDAVGAMVDTTLVYTDSTPLLSRAALTGAITASAGSNTTALGSFTKAQLDTAVSDGNVLYVGDVTQYTDEMAQDAIGAMINTSLTYVDGTPSLALTSRTIGGVAFDGTANITVASATGGFTISGGDLALGANNITMTGSLAATGARVTKGWFTDIESTNAPTVSGAAVYYSGGTDVAVADGGTGASTAQGGRLALLPAIATNALKFLRVNAGETDVEWAAGGSGATTALDNLAAVAINAALVLGTSDAFALGSATKMWSDLFLADGAVINFNNGNATLTHSAGLITSNVDVAVPDEVYGAGWNGSLEVPTKNAVYDKIESMGGTPYYTWSEETGTSVAAVVNNAYIINNAALNTITIPTTAAVGDRLLIVGKGAGGWRIAQNASEIIHFGNKDTTTGTGGRLDSTHARDTVELVCVVANTEWNVISSIGNITIT